MRSIIRYKVYSKNILDIIPKRVLNFKRSKWQKIKKSIYKKNNFFFKKKLRKKYLKFGLLINKKIVPRLSNYYKDCLLTYRIFKQFFSNRVVFFKSTSKEYNNLFGSLIGKQFFKLEILLWKLNFFNSSEEAIQGISNGFILINFKKKNFSNYVLKKGDIISLSEFFFNKLSIKKIIKKKHFLNKSFFSFLEIDFITGTIIILKDPLNLNCFDFNFILHFFINIHQLKNYYKN